MSAQSRSGLEAVCTTLLGLSVTAVALRIYTRQSQQLPIKADDVFSVLGLITYAVATACVLRMIHFKILGYSGLDVSPAELASVMKLYTELEFTFETATNLTFTFIKLSALLFYRRHFVLVGIPTRIRHVIDGTIILVVLWAFVFIPITFAQCGTHFAANWDGTEAQYCYLTRPLYSATPPSDLAIDIWVLLLPIPKIMKLKVSLGKKLSVAGVFLLAFVGIGASVARTVINFEIINGSMSYAVNQDPELAATTYVYLTSLEAGIGLVAVNLPTLWYLHTHIFPGTKLLRPFSCASIRTSATKPTSTTMKKLKNKIGFKVTTQRNQGHYIPQDHHETYQTYDLESARVN